jgi:hypothetical protein
MHLKCRHSSKSSRRERSRWRRHRTRRPQLRARARARARARPNQGQAESGDTSSREARIRDAAYAAYQRRAGEPGNDVDDWLQAESEVDRPKQ